MTAGQRGASAAERYQQMYDDYFAPDASAPSLFWDRHAPEKVAFRFVDTERRTVEMTYGEMAQRSRRAAQALAERGIGAGTC